ncbi:MAG: hypothetical protein ACFN0Y_02170 [Lactobacillus sp.]
MLQLAKQVYHYLFSYDEAKLTTYGQQDYVMLNLLRQALLEQAFVLVTYKDGQSDLGKITQRLDDGRFVLRGLDGKLLRVLNWDRLFKVDLA